MFPRRDLRPTGFPEPRWVKRIDHRVGQISLRCPSPPFVSQSVPVPEISDRKQFCFRLRKWNYFPHGGLMWRIRGISLTLYVTVSEENIISYHMLLRMSKKLFPYTRLLRMGK